MRDLSLPDTVRIFQMMSEMARNKNSVNLSQGIPENCMDAAWETAISVQKKVNWQYMPTNGMDCLQDAVKSRFYNDCFDEVTITSGCTESLLCAMHAYRQVGYTQLIVTEPYYSYYTGMAKLSGLHFVSVPFLVQKGKLALDLDTIERKATLSKSVILINSPHNPTGYVLTPDDWNHLFDIISNNHTALLFDDVYRDFNYSHYKTPYSLLQGKTAIIAGSLSKSLAATGARIGWLTGNGPAIEHARDAHRYMSNCSPGIIQQAAAEMINGIEDSRLEAIRHHYRLKRDDLRNALINFGFDVINPDGGHFIMARLKGVENLSAFQICEMLTDNYGVTPLPLDGFLEENTRCWLRFSFAVNSTLIAEVGKRLRSSTMSRESDYV